MLLLSFISLVDRSILGILSPVMLRELHLSASQYGAAILVFSICYMLANPVWGLLMDRVGLLRRPGSRWRSGRWLRELTRCSAAFWACAWRAVCWALARARLFLRD
jgi:MFS family permease